MPSVKMCTTDAENASAAVDEAVVVPESEIDYLVGCQCRTGKLARDHDRVARLDIGKHAAFDLCVRGEDGIYGAVATRERECRAVYRTKRAAHGGTVVVTVVIIIVVVFAEIEAAFYFRLDIVAVLASAIFIIVPLSFQLGIVAKPDKCAYSESVVTIFLVGIGKRRAAREEERSRKSYCYQILFFHNYIAIL